MLLCLPTSAAPRSAEVAGRRPLLPAEAAARRAAALDGVDAEATLVRVVEEIVVVRAQQVVAGDDV